jgi:hypothetical protein
MQMFFALSLIAFVIPAVSHAQRPQPPIAQQAEMKKLAFMEGSWNGSGWMMFGPNDRRTFTSVEEAESRLDGTIITVTGLHKAIIPGTDKEIIIHNAFGVISYDTTGQCYQFHHYRSTGQEGNSVGHFIDGVFQWSLKDPTGAEIRFTIRLNDKGQWHEIGERSADGANWNQIFEMTLDKVGE